MNRRNFVRNGLLAGAAASTTATLFGNENKKNKQKNTPFNLNYAVMKSIIEVERRIFLFVFFIFITK